MYYRARANETIDVISLIPVQMSPFPVQKPIFLPMGKFIPGPKLYPPIIWTYGEWSVDLPQVVCNDFKRYGFDYYGFQCRQDQVSSIC